jgi:uncharacterized protein YbdZ (MbtH family)
MLPNVKRLYAVLPNMKRWYTLWPNVKRWYTMLPNAKRWYTVLPNVKRWYTVWPNMGFGLPFKDEAETALFKDPVRTAQKTLFLSVINTSQLCCMGQKSQVF